MPSSVTDFWQLRSGEQMNRENPDTFEIPALEKRRNLQPGQLAQLIFDIEIDTDGEVDVQAERMWVLITERVGGQYVGLLTNDPHSATDFYLEPGAEVPFGPEHVIDVDDPPDNFVQSFLSKPRAGTWPRST